MIQIVENWNNLLSEVWLALSINIILVIKIIVISESSGSLSIGASNEIVVHRKHDIDHIGA